MTVVASDCIEFMTRVIESDKGLRFVFPTKGAAYNFRQRCASVRLREQAKNTKVYPEGHPSHGKTLFDAITMHVREEGQEWVLIALKDNPDLGQLGRIEEVK